MENGLLIWQTNGPQTQRKTELANIRRNLYECEWWFSEQSKTIRSLYINFFKNNFEIFSAPWGIHQKDDFQ